MNCTETKNIMIYIEIADQKPVKVSLEMLTPAREIADAQNEKVIAVVLGHAVSDVARQVAESGADQVILIDAPEFENYNLDRYAGALSELVETHKPSALFIGATQDGKDLAPLVAAEFNTGCVSDALALSTDDAGNILWTCPVYGGTILNHAVIETTRPQIGTIRSGAFKKLENPATGAVTPETITLSEAQLKTKVIDSVKEISETINLEEAEVIVSGGRGMGCKEDFALVEELAALLGGVVGATRPAIEDGWVSRIHQVGQSGKIVAPKLYIACGISGATQHLSGIVNSDYIVAINKDEDAPIFDVANVGIVGNVLKVLPTMIEEIKKLRA
ncbi:MAG: electron transfer flavoprotein subunit alpha/FixB family protein [Eubacterium sp.]